MLVTNEHLNTAEADLSSDSALDIADTGLGQGGSINRATGPTLEGRGGSYESVSTTRLLLPSRPQIRRNDSQPLPPRQTHLLPPSSQDQEPGNVNDSLSLAQLKRLVTEVHKPEARAYDFNYDDTASFAEELEEWFTYSAEEVAGWMMHKASFERRWKDFLRAKPFDDARWIDVDLLTKKEFIRRELEDLKLPGFCNPRSVLQSLLYLMLGVWGETASLERQEKGDVQIGYMTENAQLILECNGLQSVYDIIEQTLLCDREEVFNNGPSSGSGDMFWKLDQPQDISDLLTLMYLFVEAGRRQMALRQGTSLRDGLASLEPNLLQSLVKMVARLRWGEETQQIPSTLTLLLLWKSLLLIFGGSRELDEMKEALQENTGRTSDDDTKTLITASPLDYHLFRQEITSKYPAYNPQPPMIPLEPDHSSILPPLINQVDRNGTGRGHVGIGPANFQGKNSSILHQPVHIATPAPSPPPSPGGPGGKAGKKQNYQTNQNFPFLYPPSDGLSHMESINQRGDQRWKDSDVPASILEAGELFASRVRMGRALRQLWEERERYTRFARGWAISEETSVERSVEEMKQLRADVTHRLQVIEDFYMNALPHLQSLIIVLLKVLLLNFTALLTAPGQSTTTNNSDSNDNGNNSNTNNNSNGIAPSVPASDLTSGVTQAKDAEGRPNETAVGGEDREVEKASPPLTVEQADTIRTRETEYKVVSALLLLLLRWFKLSHVLKFEYLAQLVLDSNYLPLVLKIFSHQDVDKAVASRVDKEEQGFFSQCKTLAKGSPSHDVGNKTDDDDDGDEACPPPVIKRNRDGPSSMESIEPAGPAKASFTQVDELGCPIPAEPITTFSWRNFFSTINFLRIMQKICKGKAHRNLLLVQYKSSTILKKALKVPQRELRLYTLKLFKNQVPYCGRKWRQTNMRVITAVYLYCRPELRDDWLAGSDVDVDVEEALPLEQALRALTHWYNLKRYPAQMGSEARLLDEEQDFFIRELARMKIPDDGGAGEDGRESMWDAAPLPVEGW